MNTNISLRQPFADAMVNAIIDGKKSHFMQPLKWQPTGWWNPHPTMSLHTMGSGRFGALMRRYQAVGSDLYEHKFTPCPFGAPGGTLNIKEAWFRDEGGHAYRASNPEQLPPDEKWQQPRTMPAEVGRLHLPITDILLLRAGDVNKSMAIKFGLESTINSGQRVYRNYQQGKNASMRQFCLDPRKSFESYYIELFGRQSWLDNDWLFVAVCDAAI